MKNKTSKTHNLQANKTTKCRKKQMKLNFWHPQPFMMPNCPIVCHLLLFIHVILGFSHPIHHKRNLTLFQHNIPLLKSNIVLRHQRSHHGSQHNHVQCTLTKPYLKCKWQMTCTLLFGLKDTRSLLVLGLEFGLL
jgi:hypothetical protein